MVVAWHHTESNLTDRIGYDEEAQELRVLFNSGQEYIYKEVPGPVFADFLDSDSKGKFLSQSIKGQYKFEKKEEEKE